MKLLLIELGQFALLFISLNLFGQAPQGISYQSIVRDGSGVLLSNHNVTLRFTILQDSAAGTSVYQETHGLTTNTLGLVNTVIGSGSVVSGDFSAIAWGSHSFYLEVEVDAGGGFINMGTTEFMSVPYALNSGSVGTIRAFNGSVSQIPVNSSNYVFAGPTTTVNLTSTKRVTGSASSPMGGGNVTYAYCGLCYQLNNGTIANFVGSNAMDAYLINGRELISVSASTVLPPGTYHIGMCVDNLGPSTINLVDKVNGWIIITDP